MNGKAIEARIRERAYLLWQQDGELEGCADEYWRQARELIQKEVLEESEDSSLKS